MSPTRTGPPHGPAQREVAAVQLFYSPTSPYARKVRAVAIECGFSSRMQLVEVTPGETRRAEAGYGRINPLSRVPALRLSDGLVLFDSRVICDYLCAHFPGRILMPSTDRERWLDARLHALGDGICDAAVPRRSEMLRPCVQQSPAQLEFHALSTRRALDALETECVSWLRPSTSGPVTLGQVAVGCALGYLDFRFGTEPWRPGRAQLAAWYEVIAQREALLSTLPRSDRSC